MNSAAKSILLVVVFLFSSRLPAATSVSGRVTAADGRPLAGAAVSLAGELSMNRTGSDGSFQFTINSYPVILHASAEGYAPADRKVEAATTGLVFVLQPLLTSQVTVTAHGTPERLADSASSVVVLSDQDLRASAFQTLDQTLRQVPGFTLFRRSDSTVANPTTQGVSLRGVGASGASRALVLLDGVPLNDPFGGWVYWGRIPLDSLARVEILRGGASDLYGNAAVGGVIEMTTASSDAGTILLDGTYGSNGTPSLSLVSHIPLGFADATLSAEEFRTDGFFLVRNVDRGAVDTPAASRHTSGDLFVRSRSEGRTSWFARASLYDEHRNNGTQLQTNDAALRTASGGVEEILGHVKLSFRADLSDELLHQSFTSIAADRSSENLTRLQRVPARSTGASGDIATSFGRQAFFAGADVRWVSGRSDETGFTPSGAVPLSTGGHQTLVGVHAEDVIAVTPDMTASIGVRYDSWRNFDAEKVTSSGVLPFPDRSGSETSPRLSIIDHVSPELSVTGSLYKAFRAPTLNELYRDFRVGNVVTDANPELEPERTKGGEIGTTLRLTPAMSIRANLFRMEIEDNIANVTLSTTPALVTKQRQNLGETRSDGLEIDFTDAPTLRTSISAGALLVRPTVTSFAANPSLVGLDIPQVAREQLTITFRQSLALADFAMAVRWSSRQFEDDQNLLPLASFTEVDLRVSHSAGRIGEIDASVDNLLGQRAEVGRTPLLTLGPGRQFRIGVRMAVPF